MLDFSRPPFAKWFIGGETNLCHNAIDRHLAARAELGWIWRRHMGRHFPAMSMIFVADLLDHPAKIELEATAVLPT